jgi:hypothetical protein
MRRRGRPPGSGRPIGPMRDRVVELFDRGLSVAEIVATLGTVRQNIWTHLRRAGRDPGRRYSAQRLAAERAARAAFAAVWNAAQRVATVANQLGMTSRAARERSRTLCVKWGVTLKHLPRPAPKRAEVERLLRLGLRPAAVVARGAAHSAYVYTVARQLKVKRGRAVRS